MYEVDFTGWTRTSKELEKLKSDWKYRWYMNWRRFFYSIRYWRYWQFWSLFWRAIFNNKTYW